MTKMTPTQAKMVAELADLLARIADLNQRADAIKDELRALGTGDLVGPSGEPVARVTPGRRLDVDRALALVPEALREQCYTVAEPVIDAAKVKQFLAPALLETCMVDHGKARVNLL